MNKRELQLTTSGKYYIRKWGRTLLYYDLNKKRIHLAKGKCNSCGEVIKSRRCGDFVQCKCGASFVDTDRWFPERHRYGGDITIIT